MADDTFRPRKSINPSELSQNVPVQQDAIRRAAAAEMGEEFKEPTEDVGVTITGQPPEAIQKMLAQRKNSVMSPAPELRVTGSAKFEDVMGRIQTHKYHEILLPSLGRFYNGEDGPVDGKLSIRPMTGEEEQILATPALVRKGRAINLIFDRCIQQNYKSENFLTPDRTYLLIFLRGISYSVDYEVEIRCPECSSKFAHTIDLDSLEVETCPNEFNKDNLAGVLPTSGLSYSFRLSRGADEQKIQEYREKKMKGFDLSSQADDSLIYRTAMLLDSIEGVTDKTELQMILKKMPINDVSHLRNVVNNQPFGVETNIGISCPSCFAEFSTELPLESNFFFPKARKATSTTPV